MGSYPIDASVGALVWVRRRNGSWWPGRIMGLDELPEISLVSPRSGTPVKLLGREDASIDWYNLEKSKRVKAFRCGEYDECIKKAKASAANSGKKTVKYARREDAILHALELEQALIKSPPTSDSGGEEKHEINRLEDSSESAREMSRSGLSFEAPSFVSSFKLQPEQGRRRRTPNDSEDDGTVGLKRMKGLEDLGMAVMSEGEDKEGNLLQPCQLGHVCKVYSSSFKRKRSQVPNVHEFLKKKNRRRPLTKLMESTAMVSVPVLYDEIGSPPPGLSDERISRGEFSESKMSFSTVNYDQSDSTKVAREDGVSLNAFEASTSNLNAKDADLSSMLGLAENNSSDRLLDLQFPEEGKELVGKLGKQSSQSGEVETVCLRNEAPNNESDSTSSAAAHGDYNICQANERGTSEWQSKGKRNFRIINKDRKKWVHSNCIAGFQESMCEFQKELHMREQTVPKDLPDESQTPQRLLPYRQSRYSVHSRFQMSDSSVWNLSSDGSLYSVKVEMKAGYRPQLVPLVSLMSKSNSKAIIGHPLTIEILHEGFCDRWLNRAKPDLEDDKNGREVRPSSRTRSMTAKRLKLLPKILDRRSSKAKKVAQLSKKIRMLSSLTGQQQFKDAMTPVIEKPEGPVIACIPLKVVFSRINEALTGLMRSTHRPVVSTNQ